MRLDQFLKFSGVAETGGQAKRMIQGGEILVNGLLETRRRRKLVDGDVVEVDGEDLPFHAAEFDAPDVDALEFDIGATGDRSEQN